MGGKIFKQELPTTTIKVHKFDYITQDAFPKDINPAKKSRRPNQKQMNNSTST